MHRDFVILISQMGILLFFFLYPVNSHILNKVSNVNQSLALAREVEEDFRVSCRLRVRVLAQECALPG